MRPKVAQVWSTRVGTGRRKCLPSVNVTILRRQSCGCIFVFYGVLLSVFASSVSAPSCRGHPRRIRLRDHVDQCILPLESLIRPVVDVHLYALHLIQIK